MSKKKLLAIMLIIIGIIIISISGYAIIQGKNTKESKKNKEPEKAEQIEETEENTNTPIEKLNEGIMEVFADIKAKMFDKGIRIEDMDLLIAATAIYNELTLVTNNTKHFENVPNLKIENWKK